jgi:hypothetical protein
VSRSSQLAAVQKARRLLVSPAAIVFTFAAKAASSPHTAYSSTALPRAPASAAVSAPAVTQAAIAAGSSASGRPAVRTVVAAAVDSAANPRIASRRAASMISWMSATSPRGARPIVRRERRLAALDLGQERRSQRRMFAPRAG